MNPIERVWRDLKDALVWLQSPNLAAQQDYIAQLLRGYQAATLQALTGYTYLVDAVHPVEGEFRQVGPVLAGQPGRGQSVEVPDWSATDTEAVLVAAGYEVAEVDALRAEGVVA